MQLVSSIETRGMVLDADARQLAYGDQQVTFTRQEWDLLSVFLSHPNRFLTVSEIFQLGWRRGRYGSDQVRDCVRWLRQKLDRWSCPAS